MLKAQTTQPRQTVPDITSRVTCAALPYGNRYLTLRDKPGAVFDDTMLAHLFYTRGRQAEAPRRLALVTVVQFTERLSDRKVAEAVKHALI